MYSPRITERVLDDFAMREGWRPEPHSREEIEEFTRYIDSITEITRTERNTYLDIKEGIKITERRKKEIRRWMTNEKFLCFADARYFIDRYAWICNESNDIFKVQLRQGQEIFLQCIEQFDEEQTAIEVFVMKSRQVGISTLIVLLFIHRLLFVPHTQGVMASVDAGKSELLSRMLDTCWDRLPFWLTPEKTVTKAKKPEWSNGSVMSIQSGKQAVGIAQGWTPTLIHISEVADIPYPEKTLEEGLFRAAHSTAKLFFALEGTGSDPTSWQSKKWKYYLENWGKGGRFLPVFIPWACAPDLYPEKDWLRKHPIPEGWVALDETKRMRARAEVYIRNAPSLSRVMGTNWQMSREQMWFWDCNWREALASNTTKVWLAQMASTPSEAMQGKHDLVFSDDVIEVASERRQKTYDAYAITGHSVRFGQNDEEYQPDPELIDYSKPRIPVSWKGKDGHIHQWELVPLKEFDDSSDESAFDKLLIFDHPKPGRNYALGIDTADGLGMPDEDRTVISGAENRTGNARDEQVCEFVSLHLNPAQAVPIAACIAAYYGQWEGGRAGTKDPRGVKFCIEQRDRPGDDCQFQLKLMGFIWHHVFSRIDQKQSTDKNRGNQLGWLTNFWSRPWLTNKFVDAVIGGWYKPNSPMLIRQMAGWVRKVDGQGRSRMDHQSGGHDDCIFGASLSYMTAHSHEALMSRQSTKYANPDDIPPLNLGECSGMSVTV